jgi:hypothetical protein
MLETKEIIEDEEMECSLETDYAMLYLVKDGNMWRVGEIQYKDAMNTIVSRKKCYLLTKDYKRAEEVYVNFEKSFLNKMYNERNN